MSEGKKERESCYRPESDEWVKGFYGAYDHYSRILRTWLVAYGIGGPVLLLNSEVLLRKIAESGLAKIVGGLFLTGVAMQIGIAAINKATMWACYYGELYPEFQVKRRYKFAEWFSEQFWADLAIDIMSIILFTAATYFVFVAITGAS